MKEIFVTTYEAKTHLSKYLKKVSEGIIVIIQKGSLPVAQLVPISSEGSSKSLRPKVGDITSREVQYSADCFEPLSDQELEDWGL